jgi:hypothetical protein
VWPPCKVDTTTCEPILDISQPYRPPQPVIETDVLYLAKSQFDGNNLLEVCEAYKEFPSGIPVIDDF